MKFFPNNNGLWASYHHFLHVSLLELTKYALEYGFFRFKDIKKLAATIEHCSKSLVKLQDSWIEKLEKEEEIYKDEIMIEIENKKFQDQKMENRKSCAHGHGGQSHGHGHGHSHNHGHGHSHSHGHKKDSSMILEESTSKKSPRQ